jgi:hypothetical protein
MTIDEKVKYLRLLLEDPDKAFFSDQYLYDSLGLTDVVHIMAAAKLIDSDTDFKVFEDVNKYVESLLNTNKDI